MTSNEPTDEEVLRTLSFKDDFLSYFAVWKILSRQCSSLLTTEPTEVITSPGVWLLNQEIPSFPEDKKFIEENLRDHFVLEVVGELQEGCQGSTVDVITEQGCVIYLPTDRAIQVGTSRSLSDVEVVSWLEF